MKHTQILSLVFPLFTIISCTSVTKEQKVKELIEISQYDKSLDREIAGLINQPGVNQEFNRILVDEYESDSNREILYSQYSKLLDKTFTKEEIEIIIRFNKTSAGKKMLDSTYQSELFRISNDWNNLISNKASDRFIKLHGDFDEQD